jgi:ergothioneine biosynthesis protein EgtB
MNYDATPLPNSPMQSLADAYARVRATTVALCSGLAPEDTVVQSMPDTSPTRWHLAHSTWFFEQFVLGTRAGYHPLHPEWMFLFNSYYQSVGRMHARPQRGLLSRPTLAEVLDYRERVDVRMARQMDVDGGADFTARVTLGLQHEQQHQELILTDIKHAFSLNPLEPAYHTPPRLSCAPGIPMDFVRGREGVVEIGHGGSGFAFDNERPRHTALLQPHSIATRPVSNADYAEFIRDGGYSHPSLWLAEGWNTVCEQGWTRPLYWSEDGTSEFTLGGRQEILAQAPVCHVSFFEADAYARWAGLRLPTEAEWESSAGGCPVEGNFADAGVLRPLPGVVTPDRGPGQWYGDVWEWTSSPYVAYPGFQPLAGSLGEYNGKFMCGQWVSRGGSCATPAGHVRASYRNFFRPADRWQFMGFRLGRDE